jgi:predicted metal-binding membrane protein
MGVRAVLASGGGAARRWSAAALIAIAAAWIALVGVASPAGIALCGGAATWVGPGWRGLRLALAAEPPAQMLAPWLVMLAAMAPPLVWRPLAGLATRRRRLTAIPLFAAGYAAVWLAAGLALSLAALSLQALARAESFSALAAALALALAWQASPAKRAALRLCGRPPASGPTAALSHGLAVGAGCVGACWAAMLVPLVAGAWERPLMALVALALFAERLTAARPPQPAALSASA